MKESSNLWSRVNYEEHKHKYEKIVNDAIMKFKEENMYTVKLGHNLGTDDERQIAMIKYIAEKTVEEINTLISKGIITKENIGGGLINSIIIKKSEIIEAILIHHDYIENHVILLEELRKKAKKVIVELN